MTALQKRIAAIEKVGAAELADHTLQKLIHIQCRNMKNNSRKCDENWNPLSGSMA